MQQFLQRLLEEEVDELLGRGRYERRARVDAPAGYRNGFGKPRRLSLSNGTITVRRPRVRGLAERFESRLLPVFKRRTEEVGRLLPELYLHGLAQGDFDLALRGLLGDGAPLSAPSIARLKAGWQAEYELWKTPIGGRPRGRLPLGGRRSTSRPGSRRTRRRCSSCSRRLRDGRKVILAVESGYRESTESWAAILRDLKRRGLRGPEAGDRRWPSRDLGRRWPPCSRGERAAVLEPSAPERARQAAAQAPGRGAESAHEDPLRRDAGGGRAAEAGLPGLVRRSGATPRSGRRSTATGSGW